ncbi:MAG: DUF4861 domain-containing protein [Chryseolinea sp.]
MIRIFLSIAYLLFSICAVSQSITQNFPLSFTVQVSNPLNASRDNVLIFISNDQLKKKVNGFNSNAFVVMDGAKEIPSQFNSHDNDYPGIVFVLDALAAKESKSILVRYNSTGLVKHNYTKRTQAELAHKEGGKFENREYIGGTFKNVDFLRVPPEHKDHSWFIRYEGPGWESDKVGYRFYLDQRNATDVFGKKISEMVLQNVGLDGFDSYHNLQPWGMDVMKVGKSLGVGSIGSVVNGTAVRVEKTDSVNCRIVENGNVYSSILTNYYGWQINNQKSDLHSRISIHAGTRLSHQQITVSGNPENISTGLVKDKAVPLQTNKGNDKQWAFMATYGKQSLNTDGLGLAVLFNPKDVIEFMNDENSHIVKLKPTKGKLEYYFLAAWVGEPGGIQDEKQFMEYLNTVAMELSNPVKVEIQKTK